ncbi:uncharacterized protein PRCAT00002249001 [Priceomyces carsonii]|uniref:uncharacterized protein n=1 Tax=Priceomyces carsonii TaxID=28549 RepID=UPI002ED86EA6|nr:unnamed protein product [Priceomyces carsonii]
MTEDYVFSVSDNPDDFFELFKLPGAEWGGASGVVKFAEIVTRYQKEAVESGIKVQGFLFKKKSSNEVIATVFVRWMEAFYKDINTTSLISSTPNPSSIGVNNATALTIQAVYVHPDYRAKGMAESLLKKTIEYVEEEIIQEKLNTSDDTKKDNFKSMAMTDGRLDRRLCNYYLGKEYFWVLYSGVQNYYERFGFKGYPLDFYKIPYSVVSDELQKMIEDMIDNKSSHPSGFGKKLKLLSGSNDLDRGTISSILQGKELDLLMELNQQVFHLELSSGQKSSSSLTNMQSMLSMSKMGSFNALGSITELSSLGNTGVIPANKEVGTQQRRRSSVMQLTTPKVALKPDLNLLSTHMARESDIAEWNKINREKAIQFSDIKGAIITNELQQKTFYILWLSLKKTVIIGMGELKVDPLGFGLGGGRRRSSFTGLNDLGGINFQDLDLLISVACYVCRNRLLGDDSLYVSINDLPDNIPAPVLHDYFMNYLPNNFADVNAHDDESAPQETKIEFVNDASKRLRVLPMLRKFGSNSNDFQLDWTGSSMLTWG